MTGICEAKSKIVMKKFWFGVKVEWFFFIGKSQIIATFNQLSRNLPIEYNFKHLIENIILKKTLVYKVEYKERIKNSFIHEKVLITF